MKRIIAIMFLVQPIMALAQQSLDEFQHLAIQNSPLIVATQNQKAMDNEEIARLEAFYTHARVELQGDLLFVPIITTDNGYTQFKIDAQSADRYFGYDPGQTSSHANMDIVWTKPLTGERPLRDEQKRLSTNQAVADDHIRLTIHELDRQVTEQYLLCLLDQENERSFRAIDSILVYQTNIVARLSAQGLGSPADTRLLHIEQQNLADQAQAAKQLWMKHRAELDALCGLCNTSTQSSLALQPVTIQPCLSQIQASSFLNQYHLQSQQAQADYNCYRNLYLPQLSLYADAGGQTGTYHDLYKRWGASVGLHFSWTLSDGKQLSHRQRQMKLLQSTADYEAEKAETMRQTRLHELTLLIHIQDERITAAQRQLNDYHILLTDYAKEMRAGRRSTIDYVNVLHSYRKQMSTLNELNINRSLLVNTYNYWNW